MVFLFAEIADVSSAPILPGNTHSQWKWDFISLGWTKWCFSDAVASQVSTLWGLRKQQGANLLQVRMLII